MEYKLSSNEHFTLTKNGASTNIDELGSVPAEYVSTIYIDESSSAGDTKVSITGDIAVNKDNNGNITGVKSASTNVISWIRENSELYVGKYNESLKLLVVQTLDNYGEYPEYETTDSSINQYMKLPTFWYRCTNTENGAKIEFTHTESIVDDSWNKWDGDVFIGSYKANLYGDNRDSFANNYPGTKYNTEGMVLTSQFSAKPSTMFSWNDGRTITRNMGDGFSMVTYDSHKIMEILFYAYYGEVDAQLICGAGSPVSVWNPNTHINGRTQWEVGNFTDTKAGDNPQNNHFWGLSDWWGNVYEWIDNLKIVGYDDNNKIPDAYDGDATLVSIGILNPDGSINRVTHDTAYQDSITLKKRWGKFADTFPVKCTDDYEDYPNGGYTVYGCVSDGFGSVAMRSCYSDGSDGGVGYLVVDRDPVNHGSNLGSRLQYHGPWSQSSSFD